MLVQAKRFPFAIRVKKRLALLMRVACGLAWLFASCAKRMKWRATAKSMTRSRL